MGDTSALIKLLLSLSSHLHILMDMETICLSQVTTPVLRFCCCFSSDLLSLEKCRLLNETLQHSLDSVAILFH